MKLPHQTSLIAGIAAILVGLLAISTVLVVGGDTPEPAEVNTSADANELLLQAFDRLETTDYRRIVSFNTSEYNEAVQPAYYYEVSNSNQRQEKGWVNSTDGSHIRKAYANDVMTWVRTSPSEWSPNMQYHNWAGRFNTRFPKVAELSEANATVRKRSAEEIIVAIPNASSVSHGGAVQNVSERWVFTIDSQTGNIIEDEKWVTHLDGNVTLSRNEYEYGITVERPEDIPFSVEEQYYRFLAMDRFEQIGLIAGALLILVGMGELYREYPLHQKLR